MVDPIALLSYLTITVKVTNLQFRSCWASINPVILGLEDYIPSNYLLLFSGLS